MPHSCVAYGCQNRASPGQSTHFFRFPHSNEELMKKWIEAIKRKNFKPSQHSRICSDHFTNDDFQIRPDASRPLLRLDATPSVFPAFPPYYQKVKKQRKNPMTRNPRPVIDTTPVIDDNGPEPDDILINEKQYTKDVEVQIINSFTGETELKNKIKILKQKLRRKENTINNLKDLLDDLGNKGLIDGEHGRLIENHFSGEATERFIRVIDRIFDFLNTRNPFGKGFKKPL
ncbi:hypothetical protein ACI65C_013360 [Semiaphis heraclei]